MAVRLTCVQRVSFGAELVERVHDGIPSPCIATKIALTIQRDLLRLWGMQPTRPCFQYKLIEETDLIAITFNRLSGAPETVEERS
jgi:hypothetical protein